VGQIILGPFYDRLTDTMYLGPGMGYIPEIIIDLADRIGFSVSAHYNSQTNDATSINVQAQAQAQVQASSTASACVYGTLKAVNIRDFTVTITVRGGAEVVLNLTADSQVQINGAATRNRIPRNIVRTGPEREPPKFKLKDSDAAGPYLADLRSLGYSQRDLIRLWKGHPNGQPRLDKSIRVRELVKAIRNIRAIPFGVATINRILQTYQVIDERDVEIRVQEHIIT
jgi:citrate lyase gamma subunit